MQPGTPPDPWLPPVSRRTSPRVGVGVAAGLCTDQQDGKGEMHRFHVILLTEAAESATVPKVGLRPHIWLAVNSGFPAGPTS